MCENCTPKDYQIDKIYQFLEKEIALFWTRFWIFGALITAILVGWYNVITNNTLPDKYCFLRIVLPIFASIIALIQTLINRGAKRWLDYLQLKLEKDFKEYNIYDKRELNCYNKIDYFGRAFSPAKLGIIFTDLVFITCLSLFIYELCIDIKCILITIIIIIIILFILFKYCKKLKNCEKCSKCNKCKTKNIESTCEKCNCK